MRSFLGDENRDLLGYPLDKNCGIFCSISDYQSSESLSSAQILINFGSDDGQN